MLNYDYKIAQDLRNSIEEVKSGQPTPNPLINRGEYDAIAKVLQRSGVLERVIPQGRKLVWLHLVGQGSASVVFDALMYGVLENVKATYHGSFSSNTYRKTLAKCLSGFPNEMNFLKPNVLYNRAVLGVRNIFNSGVWSEDRLNVSDFSSLVKALSIKRGKYPKNFRLFITKGPFEITEVTLRHLEVQAQLQGMLKGSKFMVLKSIFDDSSLVHNIKII